MHHVSTKTHCAYGGKFYPMKIKIALDWTPNVIHAGLYLAELRGHFTEAGLEVELIPADVDHNTKRPIDRLLEKEVHLALCPSEHLINSHLMNPSAPLTAVATVMQEETSAFVTLQSSGIDRPAKLDGKVYAGYNTLLEENLLSNLIRNDGGEGVFEMKTPAKLEVFDAFLQEEVDTCWVFMPWEGVIAETEGFRLFAFHLKDYGIPYGYSPIFVTRTDVSDLENENLRTLLKVVALSYQEAVHHPVEVAKLLVKCVAHDNFSNLDFITKAMQVISKSFLDNRGQWGMMKPERWDTYIQWLSDHQLLFDGQGNQLTKEACQVSNLYSNAWLL